MALSITTNYAGKSATEYISSALFAGESFEKGLIYPVTNVKYKIALPRMEMSSLIQADSPTWNASGTLTRTEKYLTPVKLKVNFEHNIYDFENSYESEKLSAGAMNSDYPTELSTFINDLMINKVTEQIEIAVWSSNWSGASTTTLTAYTVSTMVGLLKRIDDDSPVRVTGTGLTSSNIITELAKVYNAIPATVRDKSAIGMSKYALGLYKQAQSNQASIGNVAADQATTYLGIPLYGLAGYPTNVMASFVPAKESNRNLFFGTDLLSDSQLIKIIDMRDSDGTDLFKYKMRFMGDTNVGIGAESVLYK